MNALMLACHLRWVSLKIGEGRPRSHGGSEKGIGVDIFEFGICEEIGVDYEKTLNFQTSGRILRMNLLVQVNTYEAETSRLLYKMRVDCGESCRGLGTSGRTLKQWMDYGAELVTHPSKKRNYLLTGLYVTLSLLSKQKEILTPNLSAQYLSATSALFSSFDPSLFFNALRGHSICVVNHSSKNHYPTSYGMTSNGITSYGTTSCGEPLVG